MALADLNPMSSVEDLHYMGGSVKAIAALHKWKPGIELVEDRGNEIEVRVAGEEFHLRVTRQIGGNNRNVLNDLRALRDAVFPDLEVEAHLGLGKEHIVARKSLYLAGHPKIDLVTPTDPGEIIFDGKPRDKNIVISSAPHGEKGQRWWDAWAEFLQNDQSCRYYWNPARKQLEGGVPARVRESLRGRVSIFQVNEQEAAQYLEAYAPGAELKNLPEIVGADWTVITEGARGIRLFAGGEEYHAPVPPDGMAREILGGQYMQVMDIGCGDAVHSANIAAKENFPDIAPQLAIEFAARVGSLQFHHKGSNLQVLSAAQVSAIL